MPMKAPMKANDIRKIGVIGAGTMGSAIAQHFCMKGLEVVLIDRDEESLDRGIKSIQTSLDEARKRAILTDEATAKIFRSLKTTTNKSELVGCQLVVEAIFEDLQVKLDLFKEVESYVSSECILASNTSSFLIGTISAGLAHPERAVGIHYFYHAAKNKLVEIIPSKKTSPEVITQLDSFYSFIGKTPIVVKDVPGFAINRFFVPWLNEAARLYEEGLGSITFIDEVARETFQIGLGPFALMNATGVPIAEHAADGLADSLGPFYRASDILRKQVMAKAPWPLDKQDCGCDGGCQNNEVMVRERLLGAALGVAAQMVSEGVADATSTDLGARVGLRWPKGPFEMINDIGINEVRRMVSNVFKKWDLSLPRFALGESGPGQIKFDFIKSDTTGRSGFLTFNLPDKMNPLSEAVMAQLSTKFDELEKRPEIDTIYLMGKGKAFVAGADIKYFVDSIDKGEFDRLYTFTALGHDVLRRLSQSAKKTVAYLDGLTLGGGLELALSCQYRVATKRAMLAFPETGIGIYPGLGGTQRTPRLIGKGLAKFMIATGQMVNAETALNYGLVDSLINPVSDRSELEGLSFTKAKRAESGVNFPENAFHDFDGTLSAELFASSELYKKYEKSLRRKAPLAIRKAMELIDQGMKMTLEQALKLELDSIKGIFATKDAYIGLSSILKKAKPEFKGE